MEGKVAGQKLRFVRAQIGQLRILPAVVNLDFPEYQGLQIRVPPFLDLLKLLQESGFTKMQISTPGAIGVAVVSGGEVTVGPTGGYYPAYQNTDTNNGETRADPSRWHDRRDGAVRRSRY